jgi:hypothetical protein
VRIGSKNQSRKIRKSSNLARKRKVGAKEAIVAEEISNKEPRTLPPDNRKEDISGTGQTPPITGLRVQ